MIRPSPSQEGTAPASVGEAANLYASPEFLDVIARTFYPTRRCRVEDFELEGKTFRLLTVDGRVPPGTQFFLDMHEPLSAIAPGRSPGRKLRWLARVSHGIVGLEEFRSSATWAKFDGGPTTLWRGFRTWDDYLELLRSRRVLADDQRRRRRLEDALGSLTFAVDDTSEDVLPTCFQWKAMRDRDAARTDPSRVDLFARRESRDFFQELRARGLLRASTLRAGEQLLAIWLGAVYRGRWNGWVFAFNPDPSLAKYSLGRQLLYPMLEESYRSGHEEFDFSIGLERYKYFFATHVRPIAHLGSPPVRRRLVLLAKDLLEKHPRLYERAKSLRNRLRLLWDSSSRMAITRARRKSSTST